MLHSGLSSREQLLDLLTTADEPLRTLKGEVSAKTFEKLSSAVGELQLEQWLAERGLREVMPLLAKEDVRSQAALLSMDEKKATKVLRFLLPLFLLLPLP